MPSGSKASVAPLAGPGNHLTGEISLGNGFEGCISAARRGGCAVATFGQAGWGGAWDGWAVGCRVIDSGGRGSGAGGRRSQNVARCESWKIECWLTELSPALADAVVTVHGTSPRAHVECGMVVAESILRLGRAIQAPKGLASTGTLPTQIASNPARRRAHVGTRSNTWLDGQWSS